MAKINFMLLLAFLSGTLAFWGLCEPVSSAEPEEQRAVLFPFAASAESFPEVWASPVLAEPAGKNGFIRVENGQFVNDAGPIRFWGINLCMSACFPEKETASAMARRMASLGLNIARLHHMDMREIWGKNYPKQLEFDPEKLDRLDWLISELKRNGIYVNINLHVSRKFTEADGFANYELRPDHDKGLDNFSRRMIELQKKYARDLLTHVNPYTKMSYLEDPCVAVVEINNENSIVSQWLGGNLNRRIPDYCEAELQKMWNDWLRKKYTSTEELRKAWDCVSEPLTRNQIQDSSFSAAQPLWRTGDLPGWNLENGTGAKSTLEVKDGVLRFCIQKNGSMPWHPQFYYGPIQLKKGVPFTVKFRARANSPQEAVLSCVQMDSPWGHFGLDPKFELTEEWKDYEFTFQPQADEERARVGITFVREGAEIEFDDFCFYRGGTSGIGPEESLEDGTIRIAQRRLERHRCTGKMREDFTLFVLDVEKEYSAEMYDFVKNELKCRHPVTGTQVADYGSFYPQAEMDYCDAHRYWNHPHFPGRAWDGQNWLIHNRALVNCLGYEGTLTKLAGMRVLGRPFTVSEYNHPYPNMYFTEGFPMIASLAGFQDWNGIFIFSWGHSPNHNSTASFFDIQGCAAALVHQPACFNLFVRGDVKSGLAEALKTGEANIASLSRERESTAFRRESCDDGGMRYNHLLAPKSRAFTQYTGVRLTDLPELAKYDDAADLPSMAHEELEGLAGAKVTETKSSTGELIWDLNLENQGFYLVDTPRTKVFSGFVSGRTFSYADGTKIIPGKSALNWMTLSFTMLEENADSSRWLLAATGLVRNQNAKIRLYETGDSEKPFDQLTDIPNEALASTLDKPLTTARTQGTGPSLCEGVRAKIQIPVPKNAVVTLSPLNGKGERTKTITVEKISDTVAEIDLSPDHQTIWYEVQIKK